MVLRNFVQEAAIIVLVQCAYVCHYICNKIQKFSWKNLQKTAKPDICLARCKILSWHGQHEGFILHTKKKNIFKPNENEWRIIITMFKKKQITSHLKTHFYLIGKLFVSTCSLSLISKYLCKYLIITCLFFLIIVSLKSKKKKKIIAQTTNWKMFLSANIT